MSRERCRRRPGSSARGSRRSRPWRSIDRRLRRGHDQPGLDARRSASPPRSRNDPALDAGNAGERDHGMRAEIRRRPRRSVLAPDSPARPRRCDALRRRGVAIAELSASAPMRTATSSSFLHQVDRPIEQRQRHRHVGKSGEEFGHDRQHVQAAEQDRRGDAQFAARRACPRPAAARSISSRSASTRLAPARKRCAGLGEADRARGAVEQPDAKPRFELGDCARDGGRRTAEPSRRLGKAAALGDLDENAAICRSGPYYFVLSQ